MSELIIETRDLCHYFGQQKVVDNLNLKVEKGSIYGFLGPNGAGKTTTIKLLLNLIKPHSGEIQLFGQELNTNRIAILRRTGSLVEQPAIYGHLTGRENLINRCILLGIRKWKVNDILNLVGLKDAEGKKAGKYSLGMKQRLGIGLALLSEPELLLLDEPTNGLDPNGIIEIRNLMLKLTSEHNKTILVSSHLLAEIERTATHVGIINHGKLLFQGTIDDLHLLSKPEIEIETSDLTAAAAMLGKHDFEVTHVNEKKINLTYTSHQHMADANSLLVKSGFPVYSINKVKKDLENLFLDITKTNS